MNLLRQVLAAPLCALLVVEPALASAQSPPPAPAPAPATISEASVAGLPRAAEKQGGHVIEIAQALGGVELRVTTLPEVPPEGGLEPMTTLPGVRAEAARQPAKPAAPTPLPAMPAAPMPLPAKPAAPTPLPAMPAAPAPLPAMPAAPTPLPAEPAAPEPRL